MVINGWRFLREGNRKIEEKLRVDFQKQIYLVERQQIIWCILAKQNHGNVSDLILRIMKRHLTLFEFHSIWVDKTWIEVSIYVSQSYQNTKIFQWLIWWFTNDI